MRDEFKRDPLHALAGELSHKRKREREREREPHSREQVCPLLAHASAEKCLTMTTLAGWGASRGHRTWIGPTPSPTPTPPSTSCPWPPLAGGVSSMQVLHHFTEKGVLQKKNHQD